MARSGGCQRRQDVKEFIILTRLSRCQCNTIGRVSAPLELPPLDQGFCMTTSPPEIKTGLRLGLAALAATGCLVAVLAAGLPVRAAESDPVLAKVNGSEIHASDVALAEEELGPSLQ